MAEREEGAVEPGRRRHSFQEIAKLASEEEKRIRNDPNLGYNLRQPRPRIPTAGELAQGVGFQFCPKWW